VIQQSLFLAFGARLVCGLLCQSGLLMVELLLFFFCDVAIVAAMMSNAC
jgi:hypothetical protein